MFGYIKSLKNNSLAQNCGRFPSTLQYLIKKSVVLAQY